MNVGYIDIATGEQVTQTVDFSPDVPAGESITISSVTAQVADTGVDATSSVIVGVPVVQPGTDIVQFTVLGVGTAISYQLIFDVVTTITATPLTASIRLNSGFTATAITERRFSDAFNDARSVMFLNDSAADVYTDSVLLPVGAFVHAEIQDEWAKRGIPILERVITTMTYTAGQDIIPIPFGIQDEFSAPLELWEQATAGQVWFPMTRVAKIPPPLPTQLPFLGIWEWRNGQIVVLPCSANRNIWCRYRRTLDFPTAGNILGGEGFYWALVAGTAFYASTGTQRETIQAVAGPIYRKRTMDAIQIASRDRQVLSFRQQSVRGMNRPMWRGPFSGTP